METDAPSHMVRLNSAIKSLKWCHLLWVVLWECNNLACKAIWIWVICNMDKIKIWWVGLVNPAWILTLWVWVINNNLWWVKIIWVLVVFHHQDSMVPVCNLKISLNHIKKIKNNNSNNNSNHLCPQEYKSNSKKPVPMDNNSWKTLSWTFIFKMVHLSQSSFSTRQLKWYSKVLIKMVWH